MTAHRFYRGSLSLDFAGTLGSRASDAPEERIADPASLAEWFVAADLLDGTPRVSAALHRDALAFREALARAVTAVIDGARPARADVDAINHVAAWAKLGRAELDPRTLRARRVASDPARDALGRVALDAIAMLADARERLARCALPGCGGLLLSRSRNEPRRWCSMETCGNRAKAAAFRARERER